MIEWKKVFLLIELFNIRLSFFFVDFGFFMFFLFIEFLNDDMIFFSLGFIFRFNK